MNAHPKANSVSPETVLWSEPNDPTTWTIWYFWHLPSRFVSFSYTLIGVNGEPVVIAELVRNKAADPPSSVSVH